MARLSKTRNLLIAGGILAAVGVAGVAALALGSSSHKSVISVGDTSARPAFTQGDTKSSERAPNVKSDYHPTHDPNAVAPKTLESKNNSGNTNVAVNTKNTVKPADGPLDVIAFGSASAPVTIIEYGSLSCPHCAAFVTDVLPILKQHYIDKGLVRLIFRPFMLPGGHAGIDADAGLFLACVAPARRAAWVEILYNRQAKWIPWEERDTLKQRQEVRDTLEGYATKEAGMTSADFQACLANTANRTWLQAIHDQGMKDGLEGTPTFLIAGKTYGPMEAGEFAAILDPLIAKAQGHN